MTPKPEVEDRAIIDRSRETAIAEGGYQTSVPYHLCPSDQVQVITTAGGEDEVGNAAAFSILANGFDEGVEDGIAIVGISAAAT